MKTALVIMAAGLGSRYGGDKQVDGIGPHHEILMEYSIYDAIRAGFRKVVFIIKPEMETLMRRLCGEALERFRLPGGETVEIVYAFQDFFSVPSFYAVPPERVKPFGTVHALLCARDAVQEPFCVINADDYYGVDAYRVLRQTLETLPQAGRAAMVGYILQRTATLNGTVSRGVCTVRDGELASITERLKIRLAPDGTLRDLDSGVDLAPDTVVSMNFWGFMPSIFSELERYFEDFLRALPDGEVKAECLLPNMVGDLMGEGRLHVEVLRSLDQWFGMTYHEDRSVVAEKLAQLHREGVYPDSLWGA